MSLDYALIFYYAQVDFGKLRGLLGGGTLTTPIASPDAPVEEYAAFQDCGLDIPAVYITYIYYWTRHPP